MYHYDHFDREVIESRAAEFRDQVRRRLEGELTEEQFRPLRLMNGLYLQLHAYMLRVAIPYGTLSGRQMRALAEIARRFDKGFGHFTTRQNIQFNWIRLEDMPDILDRLAEVDMHAIQTSGNCVRNITADHFAGVALDEIDDARIWCEIIRQWSTLHPEFSFLPRKFKIAVTGAARDRAAILLHDIGLRVLRNQAGELGFEVAVGGGQGRTPMIGKVIREYLPAEHLLSYLEAILRVYNRFGRRDNIYKARIKILVQALGAPVFAETVEAEWRELRGQALDLPAQEVARIRNHFAPPAYEPAEVQVAGFDRALLSDARFAAWVKVNTSGHKKAGYAIITVSLKPPGGVPGDAAARQMDLVADLADRFSLGEVRITHHQNLVLPHVRKGDLPALWRTLDDEGLGTANVGLAGDIIACPGLDYCNLASARSIPVAQAIGERVQARELQHRIGELRINISGCINACGHHHVGHIGILGVDKRGEEFYQITLGGSSAEDASLGAILGPAFAADQIADAVDTLLDTYLALRQNGERFLDAYRRLGAAPFKEAVYGAH